MATGVLTVKPIKAKITRDTDFFGSMDPYCIVVIINQQSFRFIFLSVSSKKKSKVCNIDFREADKKKIQIFYLKNKALRHNS